MTQSPRSHAPAATKANLASLVPVALALGVYLVPALRLQLTSGDAFLGYGAILLTQVLPGAAVWRAVRPRDGWALEDAVVGFAIGSALAVPAQVLAGLTRLPLLAAMVPLAVGAGVLLLPRARRRVLTARWVGIPWWLSPAVSVASLVAITQFRDYLVTNRIEWSSPGRPHIDTYLHLALSSELLHRGPAAWPTVLGEDLGYHWFTHAWIAQVSSVSGVGLDVVLMRVLPAFMPMAVALAVAMVGLRLLRSPAAAVAATLLTMAGGGPNPFGIGAADLPINPYLPLNPLSPTLALGAPTLLTLLLVITLRWRGEARSGAGWLVPLLAVVAAGTKGSTVPLVVAGLAAALVAAVIWQRRLAVRVLVDLLVVGGALVAVLVVVFHGSSAGLAPGTSAAAGQTPLAVYLGIKSPAGATLLVVLAAAVVGGLLRAALGLLLLVDREARRDPFSWLLLGAVAAGAGAVGVFSHPGLSQYYFLATALPVAGLAGGAGLLVLHRRLGPRLLMVAVAAAAVGVAAFVLPATLLGTPVRGHSLAPYLLLAVVLAAAAAAAGMLLTRDRRLVGAVAGLAVAAVALGVTTWADTFGLTVTRFAPAPTLRWPLATSQGQIDAARWMRDHSGVDDVVMTNRHCTVPRKPFGGCDSRRWVVTAFSERQSLVEGWTATPNATRIAPEGRDSITVDYWKPDILRLNDGFYTAPSAEAQRRLWDLGVRWVYMENTIEHAPTLAPYAVRRYANADASAWELLPPS